MINVAIPSYSNIKKKEQKRLEKICRMIEEIEKMWKVMETVVPVVIGTLGAVTFKVGE